MILSQLDEALGSLSARESEVLELASRGFSDKEIASQLGLSTNTLRTYWKRIREKVGDGTRTGLATIWVEATYRRQGATTYPHDLLGNSWWEIDLRSGMIRVCDEINSNDGMEPGKWQPMQSYMGFVHPDDAEMATMAFFQAIHGDARRFSFAHRAILNGELTYAHTFGNVERDGEGKAVYVRGNSLLMERMALTEMVWIGMWTATVDLGAFWADEECCRIFGIDVERQRDLSAFLARVSRDDLGRGHHPFGTGGQEAMTWSFRIERGESDTLWARSHVRLDQLEPSSGRLTGSIIGFEPRILTA